MSAEALLKDLSARGVRLSRRGDRLRVDVPPGTDTAALKATLLPVKAELLALLSAQRQVSTVQTARPSRVIVRFLHSGGAGTYLGRPGETVDDAVASLRERWPDVEVE